MTRRAAGFTLIEILIALAVLSLVLVMLAQGSRAGLRALDAYHRAAQTEGGIVPVEQALRRMIERMEPGVYPSPPAVLGTARSLVFTTELPDAAAGGALTADARLEASNGQLVLLWTPHAHGVPFSAPPTIRRDVLLDGIVTLDLTYAAKGDTGSWQTTWTRPVLPGLVRLRLIPSDGSRPWPPIIIRPAREQAEE